MNLFKSIKNMKGSSGAVKASIIILTLAFIITSVSYVVPAYAVHTSTVNLQPELSPPNQNVAYTVTFCNDASSTHSIDEVRIYRNMQYTNFVCDDKVGWDKYFIVSKQACLYVAIDGSSGNRIDPGECEDFTFSATTPGSGCQLIWEFETRDVTYPNSGSINYLSDTTGIDLLPPVTTKTYGTPFYTDGTYDWITSGTSITLNAVDPTPCDSGVDKLYWRNTVLQIPDYDCIKTCQYEGSGDWNEVLGDIVTFYKPEESCHLIEFYAVDKLGNTENVHRQCVYVDNTPPVSKKTHGTPLVQGDDFDWVTQDTQITLDCIDQGPHPVDQETMCFKVSYDQDTDGYNTDEYCPIYGGKMEGDWCCVYVGGELTIPFKFKEDSEHDLEYYCRDHLGNDERDYNLAYPPTEGEITNDGAWIQYYKVDTVPPKITKTMIGDDHLGTCPPTKEGDICYVKDDGENGVHVDVKDGGEICAVDETECSYGLWWFTDETTCKDKYGEKAWDGYKCKVDAGEFGEEGKDIIFYEDSVHNLYIDCYDALGNEKTDIEVFNVDSTPPTTKKTYGEPTKVEDGYRWITKDTIIKLTATDAKVGPKEIKYRVTPLKIPDEACKEECVDVVGDGLWKGTEVYENPDSIEFTISDDSCHLIEYYSIDKLGNEEQVHKQCVFVDNTPPKGIKTVGEPKIPMCDGGTEVLLYGATGGGSSSLYIIDPETGAATLIGPITDGETNYRVSGLAFGLDGKLYGAGHDGFIEIDPTTGAATFIAPINMPAGDTCADISFAPDGTLYCYNEAGDGWGIIDPITGANTWIGWTGLGCCGNGMDVRSDGIVYHGNEDGLNTIDPSTGTGTFLYPWTLPEGIEPEGGDVWYRPNAFDFDASDTLYASLHGGSGGSGPTYLVTIDTSNGVMTLIGQTVDNLDALAFREMCTNHWVTQNTPIYLDCTDPKPHPVDQETICYRISFDETSWLTEQYCEEFGGEYNSTTGECCEYVGKPDLVAPSVYTFHFMEDSLHNLEFYCKDYLGNKGEVDIEYFKVDTTPPTVEKTVGKPNIPCTEEENCDYWITQSTEISFTATDGGEICYVDGVKCYYRYKVDDGDWEDWTEYTGPFHFTEDSVHTLEYYCEDALGNKGQIQTEIDKVDNTPPTTKKTYGQPFFEDDKGEWISSATPITLTAEDGGKICAVGEKETYYRVTQIEDYYCDKTLDSYCTKDGEGEWIKYTEPFTIDKTSCHVIEFKSIDKLGNEETFKKQCVYVDNEAPEVFKELGEPKTIWYPTEEDKINYPESALCESELTCYKITMTTPITITCEDKGPHPVDKSTIYYRYYLDGKLREDYCEHGDWDSEKKYCVVKETNEITIYFPEETVHKLEYYCEDALGNGGGEIKWEIDKVEGSTFDIELCKKWNLISVPFVLLNSDPNEVFKGLDVVKTVWAYDDGKWYLWQPEIGGTLDSIKPGWGYWVLTSDSATLTVGGSLLSSGPVGPPSRELSDGWNLIGYYGATSMYNDYWGSDWWYEQPVYCALNTLVDTQQGFPRWGSLFTYNCGDWEWLNACCESYDYYYTWCPNYMEAGKGYWIEMDVEDEYAPATNCIWDENLHCVWPYD